MPIHKQIRPALISKTAQVALTDHSIKAPFDGIVGIASVDVGDRVTTSTRLVTLDDRSQLTVEFDVPEQYLPRLSRGMQVKVRTPGFTDRAFNGKIGGIDSRVHPTRRTVTVRATVDNSKDLLRPECPSRSISKSKERSFLACLIWHCNSNSPATMSG